MFCYFNEDLVIPYCGYVEIKYIFFLEVNLSVRVFRGIRLYVVCVYVYVCLRACMHAYVHAFACVCTCICICVHMHACARENTSCMSGCERASLCTPV